MKNKRSILNEENLVLLCFIAVGVFWIIKARSFPANPSGLDPSFFPTVTAGMMIFFCLGALITNIRKGTGEENNTSLERFGLIGIIVGLIVSLIVLSKYVSPFLGIPFFVFFYMLIVARLKLVHNILLTAITSGIIFAVMRLLHINM